MKMSSLIALLSLAWVLTACSGDPGYTGTYQANYSGQTVFLNLEQAESQVTGSIALGDLVGQVDATVTGDGLSGTVRSLFFGNVPFEASRPEPDQIQWRYVMPIGGTSQALELSFHRGSAPPTSKPSGTSIDPGLVGHWRRTINTSIAGVRPMENFNTATDIYCQLSADGQFTYGGAVTGASTGGFAGMTGAGTQVTGQWKAENQVLYSRQAGQEAWVPLGQYSISGNAMILYVGTDKQLWERQ